MALQPAEEAGQVLSSIDTDIHFTLAVSRLWPAGRRRSEAARLRCDSFAALFSICACHPRLNPKSKIVLHLHSEWFSQSNPRVLARRLHAVDLVTTVGDYVTDKTKQSFPVVADRCETTYNGIDVAGVCQRVRLLLKAGGESKTDSL